MEMKKKGKREPGHWEDGKKIFPRMKKAMEEEGGGHLLFVSTRYPGSAEQQDTIRAPKGREEGGIIC